MCRRLSLQCVYFLENLSLKKSVRPLFGADCRHGSRSSYLFSILFFQDATNTLKP
ncbi:hypothetical protein Hanom_Chr03g00240531 [Helianthus anomalus]